MPKLAKLRQMTKNEFLASFGWRNLDEAKEVIQSMREDEVVYTPQGQEVRKQLLEEVVKDLAKAIPKAEVQDKCSICGKDMSKIARSSEHGVCAQCYIAWARKRR